MSGKYLLGAGALGVSYLVYSYLNDDRIVYEPTGERIYSYPTWLRLKYLEYMKYSDEDIRKLDIKADGLSEKTRLKMMAENPGLAVFEN